VFSTIVRKLLSVCPHDNSKTDDPKVFKLGVGNDLEYPTGGKVLGQQVKDQGHRLIKCKNILKAIEWPA